jgi:hypothetical protein
MTQKQIHQTSTSNPINYTLSIVPPYETYDIDDFNCMVQQAMAIYAGWANQITPLEVEYIEDNYVWQTGEDI